MDNKTFARTLVIDYITGQYNVYITQFNALWEHMSVIETNVFHKFGGEIIYYYPVTKEFVFYQDNKTDLFLCSYKKYWSMFEDKYQLNSIQISTLTKTMIDLITNTNIPIPVDIWYPNSELITSSLLSALNLNQ